MITKRHGGFMELIPSPIEKRREVVGDNVLELLRNLNARLTRIEERLGLEAPARDDFDARIGRIDRELAENVTVNCEMGPGLAGGGAGPWGR